MQSPRLEFGPFEFGGEPRRLLRDGKPVPIGRRGTDLLSLLLTHPGAVVSKAELIETAWPNTVVEESNLSVQIALLRKALGRSAGDSNWIATVPRVGYRFVPDSTGHSEDALPSLAVDSLEVFADAEATPLIIKGLASDLVTALARFRSFVVEGNIATPGARRYRVGGNVRRQGDGLRVSLRLTEDSGALVWAEAYDATTCEPGALDVIGSRAAATIALRLQRAEIARACRSGSDTTYDIYLRGMGMRHTLVEADNRRSYALFASALEVEPANVLFLAGASEAPQYRISMSWPGITPDDRSLVVDLGHRGLVATDDDADSLSLFAMGLFDAGEYALGYETGRRAAVINPNCIMALVNAGILSLHWSELAQAEAYFERALSLAPNEQQQKFVLTGLAHVAMVRRDFVAALK